MAPGWSHGNVRAHHPGHIFHYFKGASHVSLCNRKQRTSLSETYDTAEEAYKCARCAERHENRPRPKSATRRRA
jgi:hypothetical protein